MERTIFAPAFVAFFVPGVIAEGARFIRIMCLAWGGIGVQLCIVSAFRASGNMLVTMVIALVSQFMIQFPLAYILSKHTGLQAAGLWWSFPISNIAAAIVSVCWFAQGGWKETRLADESRQVVKVVEETIANSLKNYPSQITLRSRPRDPHWREAVRRVFMSF